MHIDDLLEIDSLNAAFGIGCARVMYMSDSRIVSQLTAVAGSADTDGVGHV